MKRKWILPAIVLLLVLFLTSLYATRNQWTAYALRWMVSSRSDGQITLAFEKTEVDIFSRTLSIYDPELTFKNVYFNKARGTTLKKAKFKKLTFVNISPWDLLEHKQFICDNLSIEKPAFTLGHRHSDVKIKASSFNPGALITVLQKHEIAHLKFQFLIHHSQINFGKIGLNETKGDNIYGSARYNMSIDNMGTIKAAGGSLQPLRFVKLKLSVRALQRYSVSEHRGIKLDSAFYSSQNNTIFLNGLQVVSLDKNKGTVPLTRLYLRWAKISGLKTTKQKQTGKNILQFNSVKIVGGSYTFKVKHRKQEKRSVSELVRNMFSTYNIFLLNSLSLKHIHLFEVNKRQDTILAIKRINLDMRQIWTTKDILTDPLQSLHYQHLSASFEKMKLGGEKSPLFAHSGKAQYISKDNQFIINNFQIEKRCSTDTANLFSFSTKKLVIDSLSDKRFQKGEHQLLAIKLDFPDFRIKEDSVCQQKSTTRPAFLKLFKVKSVHLRNGIFSYSSNKNITLNVRGIYLFANGLQNSIYTGPNAELHFDSLNFNAAGSRMIMAHDGQFLKTNKLLWNNRFFKAYGFQFLQSDTAKHDTISISTVLLMNPKLNPLIFHRSLIASGAYLHKVRFYQRSRQGKRQADTTSLVRHWNSYVNLHFKTKIGYVHISKSYFNMASRRPGKVFNISSRLDLKLNNFRMGYDTSHLISQPRHWKVSLHNTEIRSNNLTVSIERTNLNDDSTSLQIQNISFKQFKDSALQFRIAIPKVSLLSLNSAALVLSDSLIFGKAILQQGNAHIQISSFKRSNFNQVTTQWKLIYDSIILNNFRLNINIQKSNNLGIIRIDSLNLLYHPNLLHRNLISKVNINLLKYWDFSVKEISYTDTLRRFHMVADRIALQSAGNRLRVGKIVGTNFSSLMLHPKIKNIYNYFLINNMSLNDIYLSAGVNKDLFIKSWFIPGMWVDMINNDTTKKKRSLSFLSSNFFSQYTHILHSIHVDSSFFKNVNFSYRYDHMRKLINIKNTAIVTSNIQLGNNPLRKSNALFGNMLINLNDHAVVSGDSLYTFHTKDLRINLADRKITLDSITLTPRYNRNDYFAKVGYQTDRVTLYGKNIVLDGFNPDDLLNNHFIHFGKLRLNNISLRLERNKKYPRRKNIIKPMPIEMLAHIPYRFRIDSVQLHNNMISYFEYERKSKNPGIFFIDNFNVLAENVTNDFPHIDSNMVLKFHGSGKLMKQANLDFTLVMPYFAPHGQWWFSAETGPIDLTQFNLMTENVLGLTIRSGIGSLQVPLITGNDSTAKGTVNFLYKKLKLRLYNRKKSQKSKKFYSPFANFMMNNIVINSNNPPFLGHTKHGIVYYTRNPEKSFINYLWKSNLSGILSTLGFNNKQQREGKREVKKQTKSDNRDKTKSEKK